MHVLMISLDTSLVTQGEGDARKRHLEYAERAGRLTIVTYTPAGNGGEVRLSRQLTLVPTNSHSRLTFALDAYRLAAQIMARQPADLITTQDPFLTGLIGLWLRGRFRVPLLVQNHSHFFENRAWLNERPLRYRFFNLLGKFIVRRADMYRTVNSQEQRTYLSMGGQPDRVAVLPVATASERFAHPPEAAALDALRRKLGIEAHHKVILWVGRPIKIKRVPVLLRVFFQIAAQMPDARLMLIGDMASASENLPVLMDKLHIRDKVVMPGMVRHAELPAYYALAKVYAHTSSYEGMPRVLAEAASAGLPLVGMSCAGVDEVIHDGENGYLLDDMDIDGMAARILELLNQPDTAHRLGEKAQHMALAQYNAVHNAENVTALWERAVALGMRT